MLHIQAHGSTLLQAFLWHYRTQAARDNCPVKVPRCVTPLQPLSVAKSAPCPDWNSGCCQLAA